MTFGRSMIFEMVQHEIIEILRSCEKLAEKIDTFLDEEQRSFQRGFGQIPDSLKAVDTDLHPPEEIDEYWDLFISFPEIQRKSELVNLYSILEAGLKSISKAYEKSISSATKINDINITSPFFKFKAYLSDVVKISEPFEGDLWKEMDNIRLVRNVITHQGGVINVKSTGTVALKLREYIHNDENLTVNSRHMVVINSAYISNSLSIMHQFFFLLFNEMRNHKQNHRDMYL